MNESFKNQFHDKETRIYDYYLLEYSRTNHNWFSFIEEKDLGIYCESYVNDIYRICDHKKWMLNKIKYGI